MKRATYNITAKEYHVIISIHALVKRATSVEKAFLNCIYISIHALVKRATIYEMFYKWDKPSDL